MTSTSSRLSMLGMVAATLLGGCDRGVPPSERSVVLVTLDTTRADRIGAFGGTRVRTPRLDRSAREGVAIDDAISQVPLTLPAHASLMTGRYPASHGVRHNGIYRLPAGETTLAERLTAAGFETAAFVGAFVLNRGFGMEQGFATYDDIPVNRFQGGQDQTFEAQRSADEVNARVFDWLSRKKPGKFFLWVHYYDPHDPYSPPEKPGRALEGEGYDREISYVDACFGDLVDRLSEGGWLDRSVLVVAGDHGESLGEHGERTHGLFLYDAALRVPLFMRSPGLVPAGKRVAGPVELVDVAPTVLDLLGLPPLEGAQGRSLRARIEGHDASAPAVAHAETLMPRLEFGWSELRMIQDQRFKYVEAPTPELFDLEADPGETRNLASRDSGRREEMEGRLSAWVGSTTSGGSSGEARRAVSSEEEERLRSLGYLGGDAFRRAGSEAGPRPDPKERIAELRLLDDARDRLRDGDASAALSRVDEVLARSPGNHNARITRIQALLDLGRLRDAEDEALAALAAAQEDPESSDVLVEKARGLLASAYRLAGKSREAEGQYRRILEARPENESAAVDLARLLNDLGRRDEARRLVERVLAADPRNGMALAARFLIDEAEGRADAALQTARDLAEARAGDVGTLVRAAARLLDAGEAARAAACLEVAMEQLPEIDPDLLARLAVAHFGAGQDSKAAEEFQALTRLRPGDPRPYHYLAAISLRRGDEASARGAAAAALGRDPTFVSPLVAIGRWLAARGRRAEAESVLAEAVSRNPGDAAAARSLDEVRGRVRIPPAAGSGAPTPLP